MRFRPYLAGAVAAAAALLAACVPGDDPVDPPAAIELSWSFDDGTAEGWEAGFAHYSDDLAPIEERAGAEPLPDDVAPGHGFVLSARNTSDDLFMFLRRALGAGEGVVAGTAYEPTFTVRFASDAPTGCVGIGGPPGEAVWMKAGAVDRQPEVFQDETGYYLINVDKGNQSQIGPEVGFLGDAANGIPCEEALDRPQGPPFALVTHTVTAPVARSTEDGELWLLVGTDSGFEGRTTLYYDQIDVTLVPVEPVAPGGEPEGVPHPAAMAAWASHRR